MLGRGDLLWVPVLGREACWGGRFGRAGGSGYTKAMPVADSLTVQVKQLATEADFARAGVAPADRIQGGERFDRYLAAGYHAQMAYLAAHRAKRFAPAELVGGARSVLCLAVSYAPRADSAGRPAAEGFIARYARGRDYHNALAARCRRLMRRLAEVQGDFRGRAFVDSAPLNERGCALAAGLGSVGRNGCLIVPGLGSYVVLCEIVSNLPLVPATPAAAEAACSGCGACRAACPTGAIDADGLVDANRCLSYLTIEHRGPIPAEWRPAVGGRLFGCDTCQQACPQNRPIPGGDAELAPPRPPLAGLSLGGVLALSPGQWDEHTRGSAIRRPGHLGLVANAAVAAANLGRADLAGPIEAAGRRMPELAETCKWALQRLADKTHAVDSSAPGR